METTPVQSQEAVVIIIGNEILNGSVHDSNSYFFCRELYELGVHVCRIITLPDDEQIIADEIKHCDAHYDLCFVAGGIGPTHDDVTISAIARGLDLEMVRDKRLEELICNNFGDSVDPAWYKMCLVPEGSELVTGGNLMFPVLKIRNIFIFPGIPGILEDKFNGIREIFRSKPYFRKSIELKASEGRLVPILNKVVNHFPDVEIGSYPLSPLKECMVRLSLTSKKCERLEEAYLFLSSLLKLQNLA